MRILFTGGGTGGHIYPILAVTEELKKLSTEKNIQMDLRFFGAAGIFSRFLEENDIRVAKILSAKLRRYFDPRNFTDILIFLPLSIIQALWKVFWFMPDVLFSKGGPSSLPIVLASKFYRVPIIIHDSDAVMGLSNRLAMRYANRIAVAFDSTAQALLQDEKLSRKVARVGEPIRTSLISGNILDSQAAKRIFGFNPEKPMILVIGGSQGAVKINDFMLEIAEELIKDYSVLHQTGINNFDGVKSELNIILKNYSEEEKNRYKIVPYFEKDLKDAYAASDVVVRRASSGSIFETAIFGKPLILIPLPKEVVGEHQVKNAYEYAKTGAAIIIEEPNLKPNIFLTQLKKVFSEPGKISQMSEAAKSFAKPEAAKIIAEEILELGSPPNPNLTGR